MRALILFLILSSFGHVFAQDSYGPAWVKQCNATSNLAYCEQQASKMRGYAQGSVTDSAKLGAAFGAAMSSTMQTWDTFKAPQNSGKSIGEYVKENITKAHKDGESIADIPLYQKYGEDALEELIKYSKRESYRAIDLLHAYTIKIEFLFGLRPEKSVIAKNPGKGYILLDEALKLDAKLTAEGEFGLLLGPKLEYMKGLAMLNGEGTDNDMLYAGAAFGRGAREYHMWANDQNRESREKKTLSKLDPRMRPYIVMNLCAKANLALANKSTLEEANELAAQAARIMVRSYSRTGNYGPMCEAIADLTALHMAEQKSADEACKKATNQPCDLPGKIKIL